VTRQPGGTELGSQIRDLLLHGGEVSPRAEALLFAADKAQHVDHLIRPALDRGEDVVTDRYTDSSIAYQGAGRDLGPDEIHRAARLGGRRAVPRPHHRSRRARRGGPRQRRGSVHDRLEREHDAFHDRVRRHFLDLAAAAPERYLVVDGTRRPRDLHAEIVTRLHGIPALAGLREATG
jgi:dTMP kinase